MILLLLAMLLRNPAPSWGHVQHVCHELYTHHDEPCYAVSPGTLRSMGFSPRSDQGIAWENTVWVDVFNGDRVDVFRVPS